MPVLATVEVRYDGDPPILRPDMSATVRLYVSVEGKRIGFRDVEMAAPEMMTIFAEPGDPALSVSDQIGAGIFSALIARGEISGQIVATQTATPPAASPPAEIPPVETPPAETPPMPVEDAGAGEAAAPE
jgi:hypothetical protein